MSETLINELANYLGELMHDLESEFDWLLKKRIAEKIELVNKLLSNAKN